MAKFLLGVILLFFVRALTSQAQISPKEGSVLNYRIIGFIAPQGKPANEYKLEIAAGKYNTDDAFKRNIICSAISKSNRIIEEVPAFGNEYTWRITTTTKGNNMERAYSSLHHFSTGTIAQADTNIARLRIIIPAGKYKEAYLFSDGTRALYNMSGLPVWYLPDNGDTTNKNEVIRDLHITPQGTITYEIDKGGAFEVNYNGALLWKAPNDGAVSGDHKEYYHHQFTRLKNGHYMVLSHEFEYMKQPVSGEDSSLVILPKDKLRPGETNKTYVRWPMGTIIEYDKKGNVVWSWKSSKHLAGTDLFYRRKAGKGVQVQAHENAFYFDEGSHTIYLSCRDISRVLKLKYPEGNILHIYGGDADKPGSAAMGNGFFCGQHSCGRTEKGYLYLYNNNACNPGSPPSVIMMQEPVSENDSLKKIWEYEDSSAGNNPHGFPTGGNVMELPDHSLFVSMAYPCSDVFIVSLAKEILWKATAEKWNAGEHKWEPVNQYRASIIASRKELEQLIWNAGVKLPNAK